MYFKSDKKLLPGHVKIVHKSVTDSNDPIKNQARNSISSRKMHKWLSTSVSRNTQQKHRDSTAAL